MATSEDFIRIAMALTGTAQAPHFDRTAFKVARAYATLAPGGASANLKFDAGEQEFKCLLAPDAFAAVSGGWGRMGWTAAILANLSPEELAAALEMAWRHALPRKRTKGLSADSRVSRSV